MIRTPLIAAALLLGLILALPSAARQPLPKPHDTASDKRFGPFLSQLSDRIADRNQDFFLDLVTDDCRISFGGFIGPQGFKDYWLGPAGPDFFGEIAQALDMGGVFLDEDHTRVVFPYTAVVPVADEQNMMLVAVIGQEVEVRSAPGARTEIIAMLSDELVRTCAHDVPAPVAGKFWKCVVLKGGETGYVDHAFVQSTACHGFEFAWRENGWALVSTMSREQGMSRESRADGE